MAFAKAFLLALAIHMASGQDNVTVNNLTEESNKTTVVCDESQELVNLVCIERNLRELNSSVIQLFLVAALSGCWVIYIMYFHSRLFAVILTQILNRFFKDIHFHIGSFSYSVLSGKVMFRDLLYATPDLSIRINDGYMIFRWWRPYRFSPWRKKKELSQGHTRLNMVIYGMDYHVYNRTELYDDIMTTFNLKQPQTKKESKRSKQTTTEQKITWWRTLIPVIKINVVYGKFIFGNRLVPRTLVVNYEDAFFDYKTTKASNAKDIFMHAFEGILGSVQIKLIPSIGYRPKPNVAPDPPPRQMYDGFSLVNTNNVEIKYYWDEPGITEEENASSDLPHNKSKAKLNADIPATATLDDDSPLWALYVKCVKRVTINYGPWADRQRELLYKFFYPSDYQDLVVTPEMEVGKLREARKFQMFVTLLHESDIDILFTKNNEVNAIHMNIEKGSSVEFDLPMFVTENGYTTNISGRFLFACTTTSMKYCSLLDAEMLLFEVSVFYPLVWNQPQEWKCDFKASKVSASLLFAHKHFIAALMDDWSSTVPADIYTFVPYTWQFNFDLQPFELILQANDYNWIDCATKKKENALVGLHGSSLKITFTLPFDNFLSPTYDVDFVFDVAGVELCVFVPESNPNRNILFNLQGAMLNRGDDEKLQVQKIMKSNDWGSISSEEWVKVWNAPNMCLSIRYSWHPMIVKPPVGIGEQEVTTVMHFKPKTPMWQSSSKRSVSLTESVSSVDDKASLLKQFGKQRASSTTSNIRPGPSVTFDPTTLPPDEINVDFTLEAGSTLFLYGTLLDHLLSIKENYLGVDDDYTDFSDGCRDNTADSHEKNDSMEILDPAYYRTLQVTVRVNLHEINGVLPIYPNPVTPHCPRVQLHKLTFELDKNYQQTRLQLLLSKLVILVDNNTENGDSNRGWVALPHLQLRGHAFFSGRGLPMGAVTIEYAWLLEVLVGPITANLSVSQIQGMVEWAQVFIFLFKNSPQSLTPAFPKRFLATGIKWNFRKQNGMPAGEEDVKFLINKIKLESIKIRVSEKRTCLDIGVGQVVIGNGNVQFPGIKEAFLVEVAEVDVKQHIRLSEEVDKTKYMEVGEVHLGLLSSHVTVATADRLLSDMQREFLLYHDHKTRRLAFMWQDVVDGPRKSSSGSVNSMLEYVRNLKSWGCNFFTPVTTSQPTYFYYKHKSSEVPSRDTSDMSTDESDDSDVFDSSRDFGMSLLNEGHCLLAKILPVIKKSKNQLHTVNDITEEIEIPTSLPKPIILKKQESVDDIKPQRKRSLVRQSHVKTGEDVLSAEAPDVPDARVTFAPSPEKHVMSASQGSLNKVGLKRAMSSDSNIYKSAESDVCSSKSSVGNDDDFYSAESDIDKKSENIAAIIKTRTTVTDHVPTPKVERKPSVSRPSSLCIDSVQDVSQPSTTTPTPLISPESEKRSTPTPEPSFGPAEDSTTDQPSDSKQHLMNCYTSFLTTSSQNNEPSDFKSDAEFIEFLTTRNFVLSTFSVHNDGIHPHVMVDANKDRIHSRRDNLHAHRELSFTSNPIADGCTTVSIHVKDPLDIQVSPCLIDGLQDLVSAAQPYVDTRNPHSVITALHIACTDDAVVINNGQADVTKNNNTDKNEEQALVGVQGAKLSVKVERARVIVLQASVGDDATFQLLTNKLMPLPSLTLFSARLDMMTFSVNLNNKRRARLLMSHVSRSNSFAEDAHQASEQACNVMVYLQLKCAARTVSTQVRVLTADGGVPSRTNITSLSDKASKCPFTFDSDRATLAAKTNLERWQKEALSFSNKSKVDPWSRRPSYFKLKPPKLWGWIIMEAGIDRARLNFVKQINIKRMSKNPHKTIPIQESPLIIHDRHPHVHFKDTGQTQTNKEGSPSTESMCSLNKEHASQGDLAIDNIWFSLPSPPSQSKSKTNLSIRPWNLLTTFSTSVKAWMPASDDLITCINQLMDASVSRSSAVTACVLTEALQLIRDGEVKPDSALEPTKHKYNLLSNSTMKLRKDPNFLLCNQLMKFINEKHGKEILLSVFGDNRQCSENLTIPALSTLKKGVVALIKQWTTLYGGVIAENQISNSQEKNMWNILPLATNIDGTTAVKMNTDNLTVYYQNPTTVDNMSHESLPLSGSVETSQQQQQTPMTTTEDLVYRQQQSMYSWMTTAVKEGLPVEKHDEQEELLAADEDVFVEMEKGDVKKTSNNGSQTSLHMNDGEDVFSSLLYHTGISKHRDSHTNSGNFIRDECLGSLAVSVKLKSLSIEKQEADKLYTSSRSTRKSHRHKSTKTYTRTYVKHARDFNPATWPNSQSASSATPVLLCTGLSLNSSIVDREILPSEDLVDFSTQPNEAARNMQMFLDAPTNRSTLHVGLEFVLDQVNQQADIALVRLIHQIVQVVDNVQVAETDLQVKRYTEGSLSPEPHRRLNSNISELSESYGDPNNRILKNGNDSASTSSTSHQIEHCWQVMYKLVDYYSAIPETVGITTQLPKAGDVVHVENEARAPFGGLNSDTSLFQRTSTMSITLHQPYFSLMLYGSAKINKVHLMAEFGDLGLSVQFSDLMTHFHHRDCVIKLVKHKATSEFEAGLNKINIKLADIATYKERPIVVVAVSPSNLSANTDHKRDSDGNSVSLHVGAINLDVPQHPASLQDVVARGTRQISVHINEFLQTPTTARPSRLDFVDGMYTPVTTGPSSTSMPPLTPMTPLTAFIDMSQTSSFELDSTPINVSFDVIMDGLSVAASVLPSLRVEYKTEEIRGNGTLLENAAFCAKLEKHSLNFITSIQSDADKSSEPSSAVIELPTIEVNGEYQSRVGQDKTSIPHSANSSETVLTSDAGHMNILVNIGHFQHCLTTDLFNQLIFLQEVFIQEMSEMAEKMQRSQKPVTIFSETSLKSEEVTQTQPLLYDLKITFEGMQLIAVTLSCNAVRLQTGEVIFELSNRITQNSNKKTLKGSKVPKYLKMFGKAQVDLSLALGTFVHVTQPVDESDFNQMAYFTTRIGLQNTMQENLSTNLGVPLSGQTDNTDNNMILISLQRPIFFVQTNAFDKAILVYLSYKSAYEEWTDKQTNVSMRQTTARQVRKHVGNPVVSSRSVFLQLSVTDLGICLPTTPSANENENELSSALVLTIENTSITACYAKSLVTKGHMRSFCIRFVDDFQPSSSDWSPFTTVPVGSNHMSTSSTGIQTAAVVMNSCIVPEGSYEICSDTIRYYGVDAPSMNPSLARTMFKVQWQMKGLDINLDTKIGTYLSRLYDFLTAITGEEEASQDVFAKSESMDVVDNGKLPRGESIAGEDDARTIERKLNEQVKLVHDFRQLGAKPELIKEQEEVMKELEAKLSSNFRRVVRSRLRKSAVKPAKTSKSFHQRTKSATGISTKQLPLPKESKSAYSTLPHQESNIFTSSTWKRRNPDSFYESSDESDLSSDDEEEGVIPPDKPTIKVDRPSSSGSTNQQRNSIAQMVDADLEYVWDVAVVIDSGKIECHPMKTETEARGVYIVRRSISKTSTVFAVPSVDLKVQYSSATSGTATEQSATKRAKKDDVPNIQILTPSHKRTRSFNFSPPTTTTESDESFEHQPRARACVYARCTIQSISEMTLSPYFLDFLEQTLATVTEPSTPQENNAPADWFSYSDEDISMTADVKSTNSVASESSLVSLPIDVVVYIKVKPSEVRFTCVPLSRVECLLHIPDIDLVFSSVIDHTHNETMEKQNNQSDSIQKSRGGMNFTAILSDFSIYIFHPYGNQAPSSNFPYDSFVDSSLGGSPSARSTTGKKDSLSVNLEFVKINLVRTREHSNDSDASIKGRKSDRQIINLSGLVDIGKASFNYDMRRLNEILAFPRAWFRKSIARRLFLGDTPSLNKRPSGESDEPPVHPRQSTSGTGMDNSILSFLTASSPMTPRHTSNDQSDSSSTEPPRWKAKIVLALNLSQLYVEMNMSNVMGHTVWTCDHLHSNATIDMHSRGDKDIVLSCGIDNSDLTAKGGIIGGHITLDKLKAICRLSDPSAEDPIHKVTVRMEAVEGRIEYMGTICMMGQLTQVTLHITDEWLNPKSSFPTYSEKNSVFVHGDLGWHLFNLSISRSSTPDVLKMLNKLEEFFRQQMRNSVQAFASWKPSPQHENEQSETTNSDDTVYDHRRHWPPVFQAVTNTVQKLLLTSQPQFLLGGSFQLHGDSLTVVCFHGVNFRARSWVLFNILQPNIVFSTEVQQIKESIAGNESSTLAIQSLTFNLGHDAWLSRTRKDSDPMATVSRVTRSRNESCPLSTATVSEWFNYVTATHKEELRQLRTLNDLSTSATVSSTSTDTSQNTENSYDHETDIIFALPKAQLDFKTEHLQAHLPPNLESGSEAPRVDCSFVTEFTDHICVTMDVELIMFLHELVSGYLKEKQHSLSSKTRLEATSSSDVFTEPVDLREFVCNTWQLEPTVRLISWAGKRIEPVGVDYILQKLGFKHARTTIPKWVQRGLLDVLDKSLATIVEKLVISVLMQQPDH